MLDGGHPYGVTIQEKQVVTRKYKPRYQRTTKNIKSTLLHECTLLAGYHRKSAIHFLSAKPVREVLVSVDRKLIKLKPEKPALHPERKATLY
jgi:hypothetical protein